jgi:hypothetical protein
MRYALPLSAMLLGSWFAFGIDLADIQTVEPHTPIEVDGTAVQIRTIDGDDLPDSRIIQLVDRAIFAAPPGRYLVISGDRVGMVLVEGSSIPMVRDVQTPVSIATTPATNRTNQRIWFLTRANCETCDRWKANELAAIEAAGIEVITDSTLADQSGYSTPAFLIPRGDGTAKMLTGYRSAATLLAALDEIR